MQTDPGREQPRSRLVSVLAAIGVVAATAIHVLGVALKAADPNHTAATIPSSVDHSQQRREYRP